MIFPVGFSVGVGFTLSEMRILLAWKDGRWGVHLSLSIRCDFNEQTFYFWDIKISVKF